MVRRRKARELALQLLFQVDLSREASAESEELFWERVPVDQETRLFAERLYRQAVQERERIDGLLRRHSRNWRLERMAAVDRNLLRLAVAEMLSGRTPGPVIMDEAVEIARKYGGEDSPDFVNGILDAVWRELALLSPPSPGDGGGAPLKPSGNSNS